MMGRGRHGGFYATATAANFLSGCGITGIRAATSATTVFNLVFALMLTAIDFLVFYSALSFATLATFPTIEAEFAENH
jgi:hypothetical protein